MVQESLFLALLYIALLFFVAWWAERRSVKVERYQSIIYSLALAVYCSSWTFFGAVGTAAESNWSYLPIYLGPCLMFVAGWPLIRRLVRMGARQQTTSIADFIGSRYGKSQALAATVTVVAVLGTVPYIALQLKGVSMAWKSIAKDFTEGMANESIIPWDASLTTAMIMALFAILFGTRELDGRERHRGMMTAIALESLVKLFAFAAVALLSVHYLFSNIDELSISLEQARQEWLYNPITMDFTAQLLLAMLAVICLPRQFHVAVVEYQSTKDEKMARWGFPIYLALFSVMVIPITVAGKMLFPSNLVNPDDFVLIVPMQLGQPDLVVFAFLGGVSAATGMVIVATITLATMLSNEIVLPLWLRRQSQAALSMTQLGNKLRIIRRICIVFLLMLSWAFYRLIEANQGLAEIGLISFAAAAQLAPALIGGLYWKSGHRNGVFIGLALGFSVWFFCLLLPVFLPAQHDLLQKGAWGIDWLRPHSLLGVEHLKPLSQAVFWSLFLNSLFYVLVSKLSYQGTLDHRQSMLFLGKIQQLAGTDDDLELTPIRIGQLKALMIPFLGKEREVSLWRRMERHYQQRLLPSDRAPRFVVHHVETVLAAIIGSNSAHQTIELLEHERKLEISDLATLVDSTSRQSQFNRELLQLTVESIPQGISVVDDKLRLVAWNQRYQELFDYPERLLYIGCPIAHLYRFNAERGFISSEGGIDAAINKRLALLSTGGGHRFERQLPNGKVLEVQGRPLPALSELASTAYGCELPNNLDQ